MADLVNQRVIRAQREQARSTNQQKNSILCPLCPSRHAKRLYEKEEQLMGHVREAHEDQDVDISEIRELVKSRSDRDIKRLKSSRSTSAVRQRSASSQSEDSIRDHTEREGTNSPSRLDDTAAVRSAKKLGELSLSTDEKRLAASREQISWKGRKRGGRRTQTSAKGHVQNQQNVLSYSSGMDEGYNSELVSHRGATSQRQVRSQHGKLYDPGKDSPSTAKSANLLHRPVSSKYVNTPLSTPDRIVRPGIIPVPKDKSVEQILASQAHSQINPDNSMSQSNLQLHDIGDPIAVHQVHYNINNEQQYHSLTNDTITLEQKCQPEPGILKTKSNTPFFKEPESREIPEEALNAEVKMIYTGLTHIETKCRTVDQAQGHRSAEGDSAQQKELTSDHWRALIALHRSLLNEHHDFFLASQHPSASPALKRLASRYSMPARLWRHGIHSFLEVLRHRLPESLEYMLAFIYLAYRMMSLLYETVPAFESTWIECLGDLGRYRMAIEDVDMRDREVWNNVARYWYAKAADRNAHIGRLYHHLAILARSDPLQQVYLYSRSLTSVECFHSARDSVRTLLDPVVNNHSSYSKALAIDRKFIKLIAILFDKRNIEEFDEHLAEFLQLIGGSMDQAQWKGRGVYVVVSLIGALLDFGSDESSLYQAYKNVERGDKKETAELKADKNSPQNDDISAIKSKETENVSEASPHRVSFVKACELLSALTRETLQRHEEDRILPSLHVLCVFLSSLFAIHDEHSSSLVKIVYAYVPWNSLARTFDLISMKEKMKPSESPFQKQGKDDDRPLPEDYLIRGQIWCQNYFPDSWFEKAGLDEEERKLELSSTAKSRIHRVLSVHRLLKTQCSKFEQRMAESGESLDVKKTDDVEMPDKSNQPLVESKSGGAVEENFAGKIKPFQLMERDSAGLQGQARNIGWKPSEQSKREEVLLGDEDTLSREEEDGEALASAAVDEVEGEPSATSTFAAKVATGKHSRTESKKDATPTQFLPSNL